MSELEEKISKLEKALNSPSTPENLKAGIEANIAKLKAQLKEADADAELPEEPKEKPAAKPADKPKADSASKEAKKSTEKPAEKTKLPKMTKEDKDKCEELLKEMRAVLNKHQSTRSPRPKSTTTRRVSTVVAEKLFNSVAGAVRKEMSRDKVNKVKVDKLREVRDDAVKALKALRQALGGISGDNDGFIKHFTSLMNELIEEVEKKQKSTVG